LNDNLLVELGVFIFNKIT